MAYCGLPERLSGPYNQTLFLGCSVSNFTCNLGWGADQSTLTVNLVEDNCYHPQSSLYGQIDSQLDTYAQQPESTPSQALVKQTNPAGNAFTTNDPAKTLHKSIVFQAKDLEDTRDAENRVLSNDNKDFGKVCYDIVTGNRVYWQGPDPLFIGAPGTRFNPGYGFDILGVPVRFKFNDFNFGGIVSSWKQTGSQAGLRSFEVEIKSFSSLLNGVQLIINSYAGTVCGIAPNTANNPIRQNIALPMPYNASFPENSPPIFTFFDHRASIAQGNIPNVVNIFGYLEYIGLKNKVYGNSFVNDDGLRAQYIYDAIVSLLGPLSENNPDSQSPFSPYGAIICKTIRQNTTAVDLDPIGTTYSDGSTTINLGHMGICPNFLSSMGGQYRRSRLKIDISEVPRPPKWLRMQGPVISIMQFISEICDGAGFDFFVDFIPSNNFMMSQSTSGTIKIRTVSRRQQPKKEQIQSLVDYLTKNSGVSSYTKGKEFTDSNTRTMYIGGKQKRLLQFKTSRLAYTQNTLLWDPWAGAGTGGNFIDFNPATLVSAPNVVRTPNTLSTRRYSSRSLGGAAVVSDSSTFNNVVTFGGAELSRPIRKGNYNDSVGLSSGLGFESIEFISRALSPASTTTRNIPLYTDAICPYFGVGSNGLIRPVYFDKNMGQMQIVFQVDDIRDLTSLPLKVANFNNMAPIPGFMNAPGAVLIGAPDPGLSVISTPIFLVLENEIRAAGAGFLQWLTYCFNNIFATDISMILYKAFKKSQGFTGKPAKANWLAGMGGIISSMGAQTIGLDGRVLDQLNLAGIAPFFQELHGDLEKIHGFFQNIANEYYGKKYMVRMPEVAWYRDLSYALDNTGNKILIGGDESGALMYALEGTGKVYTNYSVSTDGAWEEPGNFIDDTMVTGGIRSSFFSDDSGKIGGIIGFNASQEFDNGRLWARQTFVSEAIQFQAYNDQPYRTFNWSTVMKFKFEDPLLQEANHWYSPLVHQLSPDEHMVLPYLSPTVRVPRPYGVGSSRLIVPGDRRFKMYVKSTPSDGLEFLAPNSTQPRAIMSISSPVFFGAGRSRCDTELNAIMIQDSLARLAFGASVPPQLQGLVTLGTTLGPFAQAAGSSTINEGLGANPAYENYGEKNIVIWSSPSRVNIYSILDFLLRDLIFAHIQGIGTENEIFNGQSMQLSLERPRDRGSRFSNPSKIMGKAAHPLFCALPVELNDYVYGPWINHPGLISRQIFPEGNDILEVENLIGGVKVVVDESLTPWNYGGMTPLDTAVMLKIADDVNYQQTLENGSIQVPGFTNFNLGDAIQFYGNLFGGPIITSINVQINEAGINTTYNLRTYTRKLGFFNKENSERIKAINQESIRRNKEINNKLMKLASKIGIAPGGFRIV